MGLAIVKQIAELYEGTVSATSEVGVRTTMKVTLPGVIGNNETPSGSDAVDATQNGSDWLGVRRREDTYPGVTN